MAHIDLETKILNKNDEGARGKPRPARREGRLHGQRAGEPRVGQDLDHRGDHQRAARQVQHRRHRGATSRATSIRRPSRPWVFPRYRSTLPVPVISRATWLRRALDVLDLDDIDLIFIENVGNLVCPADFYLGENIKMMILSAARRR